MKLPSLSEALQWAKSSIPKAPQAPAAVSFVPGHIFFCLVMETSSLGSAKEVKDAAALLLEETAPFSLDQLYWGLYWTPGAPSALLWATPKERCSNSLELGLLSEADYILPSFLPALALDPAPSGVHALVIEGVLSLVANREPGVSALASFDLDSEGSLEDSIRAILKEQGVGPGYWKIDRLQSGKKGELGFTLRKKGSNETQTLLFPEATLWLGDIRESSFKEKAQRSRMISRRLWRISQGILVVFAILLAAEGIYGIQKMRLTHLKSVIAEQTPKVNLIQEHDQFFNKLQNLASETLDPFAMLRILNRVRPKEIYFAQFSAENLVNCTVRGFAKSVAMVNEYAADLGHDPEVQSVDLADVQSRQGKVSFTLEVIFKPTPSIWLSEKAQEAPEKEPTESAPSEETPPPASESSSAVPPQELPAQAAPSPSPAS